MVKANHKKISLLLSGAIILALASSAFAADTQQDDQLIMDVQATGGIMGQGNGAAPTLNPDTGTFSTPGYTPITLNIIESGGVKYLMSSDSAAYTIDLNKVFLGNSGTTYASNPPPGSLGMNSSDVSASVRFCSSGLSSGASQIPSMSTPAVWAYTLPAPAAPGNLPIIAQMQRSSQTILGPDFIRLSPDRFLASTLASVIPQIAMSSPSINIPGRNPAAMPESSLIAVVTPTGIGIYAPAYPGINTNLPVNANMAPSVQIISGSNYMRLAGTGFMAVSVGELQATAPISNAISLQAMNSAPSQLPGYLAAIPDSSFITVAITPTTAIYIPGNLSNPANAPQANENVQNLIPEAKVTPVTQIILGADLIKFEGDGYISINSGDVKATVPTTANAAQIPDSPFIAVVITTTEAVYMPDPQTITLAKKTPNTLTHESIKQPQPNATPIVWSVFRKSPGISSRILTKVSEIKAKQTIIANKLTKKAAKQTRNITNKTAKLIKNGIYAAKTVLSNAKKEALKYVRFAASIKNKALEYIRSWIKGIMPLLRTAIPDELKTSDIVDFKLPVTTADQNRDPLGPPIPKTQAGCPSGDPVPFDALISRTIPNRIINANMFFIDIIKKNAVNYSHTGLSPPQTVSPNSTALLSALNGSVYIDSSFVIPAHLLNETVSPSLLNAYLFNFKAGDFCLFINLFKNGGRHV